MRAQLCASLSPLTTGKSLQCVVHKADYAPAISSSSTLLITHVLFHILLTRFLFLIGRYLVSSGKDRAICISVTSPAGSSTQPYVVAAVVAAAHKRIIWASRYCTVLNGSLSLILLLLLSNCLSFIFLREEGSPTTCLSVVCTFLHLILCHLPSFNPSFPHSWCSNGSLLATGSRDGVCKVWAVSDDITDSANTAEGELHTYPPSIFFLTFDRISPFNSRSLSTLCRHQLKLSLSTLN